MAIKFASELQYGYADPGPTHLAWGFFGGSVSLQGVDFADSIYRELGTRVIRENDDADED